MTYWTGWVEWCMHKKMNNSEAQRYSWGMQKKNGEPQRYSWGMQKKNGEPQRYSWGMQKRMVNRRDIAGECRRRMVNRRDIAGECKRRRRMVKPKRLMMVVWMWDMLCGSQLVFNNTVTHSIDSGMWYMLCGLQLVFNGTTTRCVWCFFQCGACCAVYSWCLTAPPPGVCDVFFNAVPVVRFTVGI